jgi:hypothetical protein
LQLRRPDDAPKLVAVMKQVLAKRFRESNPSLRQPLLDLAQLHRCPAALSMR